MSLATSQLLYLFLNVNFNWGFCISGRSVSQSTVLTVSNSVHLIIGCEESEMIGSCDGVSDISESLNETGSVKIIIESSTPSVGGLAPGKKRSGCGETSFDDFG